jgi:hypothetical protein
MARVFAVQVQILLRAGAIAVQGWLEAGNKSRYIIFICGHWRGRGISYYKAVKRAGVKAKTVTSL